MKISLLSSSTAGLLSIFTIIILLTSANLVRADIAPPPFPKAAGIYPNGVSTEVRMVSEVVDITIIDQVSQDFPDGHARVKAIFQMLNLGTALEKMDVYFPLDWDKCEQDVTKMRLYEFKRNPTMRDFHVLVGGTEVPFTTLYQRLRAEMSTDPQETDVACWIYFPTLFPVGKTVTIEVNYQTPAEARWGKDYPYVGYSYILQTGAGWKDTIGSADITVHMPYSITSENIIGYAPDQGTAQGRDITWHFENFEPEKYEWNVGLGMLRPAIWKAIQSELQNIKTNPRDGEAWGRLGKAYKEALIWYSPLRAPSPLPKRPFHLPPPNPVVLPFSPLLSLHCSLSGSTRPNNQFLSSSALSLRLCDFAVVFSFPWGLFNLLSVYNIPVTSLASPRHLAALSLTALLALFLLSACQPTATPTADFAWQPADLRALQAPAGPDPAYELVAAYARLTPTDLELRFDFLGSPAPFGYDLYLFLDTIPGGTEKLALNGLQPSLDWDIALGFPAQGLPRAFDSAGSPLPIRPRILRDSVLDSATVRISRKSLPADPTKIRFQAFAVSVPAASAPPPGGLAVPTEDAPPVASSTGPLSVSGAPPETTARLLLSFWDAFPSATPAQALRRWDGAHTGPYGQRHGLGVLLSAAEQNGIPLALLDLKRADQLAALDAVGGLAQLQQSQRSGLLLLPDLLSSVPQDSSRAAGQVFGLSGVPFFYGPVEGSSPPGYKAAFGYLPTQAGVSRPLDWNGLRLVPLPAPLAEADPQVDEEGLTLPARQALLALALSSGPAGLVSLGGSLPTSAWGDSLIAGPAMRYIAGHPWIRVLDGSDLLKLPAAAGAPTCPDLLCLPAQAASPHQAEIRQTIQSAPAGLFKDLARQAYQRLTQPTGDEKLQALHASYIGQVGPLLAAARWHANPPAASESAAQPDCSTDLDWDGASECVLASARFFLVLSPQGGRLVFAAMRINGQPVQLIGPRSQFVVGLGDSLDWKPELGLAADPQEIPGAFADPFAEWQTDQVETGPGSVVFIHPQTGARKRFELTTQGIRVTIQGQSAPLQLPLALIDTTTYTPGGYGRYQAGPATPGSHTWSLGSLHLQVTSQGASFDSAGFTESSAQIIQPEDPNAGYPPGHYIPFPLAVLTFQPQDQLMIVVSLKNGD